MSTLTIRGSGNSDYLMTEATQAKYRAVIEEEIINSGDTYLTKTGEEIQAQALSHLIRSIRDRRLTVPGDGYDLLNQLGFKIIRARSPRRYYNKPVTYMAECDAVTF